MFPCKRIYLVEDDELVSETLSLILEQSGYVITTYAEAESALSQIAKAAPDLVMSDILLAGRMAGVELAQELAESFPHIKLMLMSGIAETPEVSEKQLPHGLPYRVHAKPISPRWLIGEIARVLSEAESRGTKA